MFWASTRALCLFSSVPLGLGQGARCSARTFLPQPSQAALSAVSAGRGSQAALTSSEGQVYEQPLINAVSCPPWGNKPRCRCPGAPLCSQQPPFPLTASRRL